MLASCITVVLLRLHAEGALSIFILGIADPLIMIRLGQVDIDRKDQDLFDGSSVGMAYIQFMLAYCRSVIRRNNDGQVFSALVLSESVILPRSTITHPNRLDEIPQTIFDCIQSFFVVDRETGVHGVGALDCESVFLMYFVYFGHPSNLLYHHPEGEEGDEKQHIYQVLMPLTMVTGKPTTIPFVSLFYST
jgi:hypothetical protein